MINAKDGKFYVEGELIGEVSDISVELATGKGEKAPINMFNSERVVSGSITLSEEQANKIKLFLEGVFETIKKAWNQFKDFINGIPERNLEMAIEEAEELGISHKMNLNSYTKTNFFKEFTHYLEELKRLVVIYSRTKKYRIKKKQLSRMKKLRREALLKGVYLGGVVWNSEMNTSCSLI